MSEADGPDGGVDEFDLIAALLRPLAAGAPEALNLADDAALIPSRPGQDLVITKDAMVEGVHFLPDDPLDLVARKLLRVNLSDLAAKAALPYGYFLAVAWPSRHGLAARTAFAAGLAHDQALFGIRLMGGDTTATPGSLTLSLTALGWAPSGAMVRRAGARPGDLLLVSGTIGDGWLGLEAAQGGLAVLSSPRRAFLADRYRLPQPRVDLRTALASHAAAAADVSDGLLADAGHIGEAGGCAVAIDLDRLPLSDAAAAWLALQPDRAGALGALAAGGDDYEIVCAARPEHASALEARGMTAIGRCVEGEGVCAVFQGRPAAIGRMGYRHR